MNKKRPPIKNARALINQLLRALDLASSELVQYMGATEPGGVSDRALTKAIDVCDRAVSKARKALEGESK